MSKQNLEKIIELLITELEHKETEIYFLKLKIEELKKVDENNG